MPSPHFESFCRQVCAAAGVAAPRLETEGAMPPSISIDYQGVRIGLVQAGAQDTASAVMLVDFGPPPVERQAEAFRVLLESNFLMLGERSPAFGLDPTTGHVIYHQGFRLAEADPEGLGRSLGAITDAVARWRDDPFPPQAVDPAPADLA